MTKIRCPNCGHSLDKLASDCPCGYSFVDEALEMPAPGVVRTWTPNPGDRVAPDAPETAQPDRPAEMKRTAVAQAQAPARPSGRVGARPNEAMIMGCPGCGARISRRAARCPKCGTSPYGTCQICASIILANTAPCSECGDPEPFAAPVG